MFLRGVMKRWKAGSVGAAHDDEGAATCCPAEPSLLEELAADSEDFAELAAVLKLDLPAVIAALVTEQRQTPAQLVERLAARESASNPSPPADAPPPAPVEEIAGVAGAGGGEAQVKITVALAGDETRLARVRELCAGVAASLPPHLQAEKPADPRPGWLSWGGGGEVGWGRWTRARGGARVHREAPPRAVRPVMAPS